MGPILAQGAARRLLGDDRGAVAVLFSLILPVIVGFLALGVEVSAWYLVRRELQTAADVAAMAAVYEIGRRNGTEAAREEALRQAAANGWDAADGAATVISPPLSGPLAGNGQAVEVVLERRMNLLFSRLYLGGANVVRARSVARTDMRVLPGSACVIGLDGSASHTVHLSENSTNLDPNCGVYSNSDAATSLVADNNAYTRSSVSVVGDWRVNATALRAELNARGVAPIGDPYADMALPPMPGCTSQTGLESNRRTLNFTPGRWCQGWDFMNNVTINLAPGTYFVEQRLDIKNGVRVTGTGVTIVLVGGYANGIGNNAVVDLRAPTSGPLSGMVIMNDRTGSQSTVQVFSNNSQLNLQGVVYFPNQVVELANNAFTGPTGCAYMVGRRVRLMQNAKVGNHCDGTGVRQVPLPSREGVLLAE